VQHPRTKHRPGPAEDRIGRAAIAVPIVPGNKTEEVVEAINRIDLIHVGPIERIERVHRNEQAQAFVECKRTANPEIESIKIGAPVRIARQLPDPISDGIGVAVGIVTHKEGKSRPDWSVVMLLRVKLRKYVSAEPSSEKFATARCRTS